MINDFNISDEETFTSRMNQFSDLTSDQFKLYIHGHDGSCMQKHFVAQRISMKPVTPDVNAPDSIHWTNYNRKSYVTLVKNQGQCGSYWVCNAFNIYSYSQYAISHIYIGIFNYSN